MPVQSSPFYLVPANEPFIKEYDLVFNRFAESDTHTLVLDVMVQMVEAGEVAGLQQVIIALQHKPALIEKMIFALDLRFTEIEGSDLIIPSGAWKGDPTYMRWFRALAASPVMIFFLRDEDARFYTLAGDMLADNQFEIKEDEMDGKQMVGIGGDQLIEVLKRLLNSCWWMLFYCHGSGFDPEPYIQSLLADLDLPLTYEEVYEAYQKDLEKGIKFRTVVNE